MRSLSCEKASLAPESINKHRASGFFWENGFKTGSLFFSLLEVFKRDVPVGHRIRETEERTGGRAETQQQQHTKSWLVPWTYTLGGALDLYTEIILVEFSAFILLEMHLASFPDMALQSNIVYIKIV